MGYAIPSNVAIAVAENIIDNCDKEYEEDETPITKMSKAILGVTIQISSSRAVYDGYTMTTKIVEDIVVSEITENSLVDGKLQVGDIIKSVAINSKEKQVTRSFYLSEYLINARVGDTVTLKIIREEEEEAVEMQVVITLTEESFSAIN